MAARREALLIIANAENNDIPRPRVFRDRSNPLENYDRKDLIAKYRFDGPSILHITELVAEELNQGKGNHALPPLLQVCIALRFFACGAFQETIGDTIRVSKSTVSRAIYQVSTALMELMPQYVEFPNGNELGTVKTNFFEKANFPNVIGAIDGTHVRIQAPHEYEEAYVNRKGYHSINVQVVVDAKLLFRNAVVRWPGSVHDSRIFTESQLFQQFSEQHPAGYLLGDSGYQIQPFLLTPFPAPSTRQEQRYNNAHATTRNVVERAIGVLKRRFACLNMMRLRPERVVKSICSCIILHNIATKQHIPLPEDNIIPDMGDMGIVHQGEGAENSGMVVRAAVARNF